MSDSIIQVLRLLAGSPEMQVAAFPEFVTVADEIALLFHDSFTLPGVQQEREMAAGDYLREIDELLDRMSQRADLWSNEALRTSDEWARLRVYARDALRCFGEEVLPPDLSWVRYVRG